MLYRPHYIAPAATSEKDALIEEALYRLAITLNIPTKDVFVKFYRYPYRMELLASDIDHITTAVARGHIKPDAFNNLEVNQLIQLAYESDWLFERNKIAGPNFEDFTATIIEHAAKQFGVPIEELTKPIPHSYSRDAKCWREHYPGGFMVAGGADKANALRSLPMRVYIIDDLDPPAIYIKTKCLIRRLIARQPKTLRAFSRRLGIERKIAKPFSALLDNGSIPKLIDESDADYIIRVKKHFNL